LTSHSERASPKGFLGLVFGNQALYVRKLVPLFIICLTLFCFSLGIGFFFGDNISGSVLEELIGEFPDLENYDVIIIFLFIFFNNVSKSFLWMVLGVIGSIPPLFFAIINGFFLGWFSQSVVLEQSLGFTLAALLPHGVIEIPTILLSSAAGMGLGYQVINRIRGKGSIRTEFGQALRLFIYKIIPLLLLSAVIEVTLTPTLIGVLGLV
jgi:stage II sporulation protein M